MSTAENSPKKSKGKKRYDPAEDEIWQKIERDQEKVNDDRRMKERVWRAAMTKAIDPLTLALMDAAWAAGLFDGEGHASARQHAGQFDCAIDQVDLVTLERFQAFVGGVGKIHGPRRRTTKMGKRQLIYTWKVTNHHDLVAVWNKIGPYLGPAKRDQFARAVAVPTVTKLANGQPLPDGTVSYDVPSPRKTKR